ncbi:MAG TPA: PaaX family transcriptional regulator C-terminal domain-containing protein [Gaiellaceae bacterium]|jgi:phenylacetic acid degradation operon negative regulatory protein|nr:PaaX family transcriptional regulator C-terminal domain-containing protein [Gaiellaceae bacterium]
MKTATAGSGPGGPAGIALLMILGFSLLDGPPSVWQEALVSALQRLGYTGHAARQAVARATRHGLLSVERHGRRARMSLSPAGVELLRDGERRLFAFGEPWTWDGSWLLLNLRVPEAQREVRHRLRKQLAWAGLGSLGNGIWLTPHLDREPEVVALLSAEPVAQAWTFHARHGDLGDLDKLVRQAWDIDAMVRTYERFVAEFEPMRPTRPDDCFVALTSMLMRWRTFPFIDPDLPPSLLPNGRLRQQAYTLFHDRKDRWLEQAREFIASCQPARDVAEAAHLV